MVSCSDYDDDINNLNQRVDAVEKSISDLKAAIEGGKTITSVESAENGFKITFSDGQSYLIQNGEDGQSGDKWTIGQDGFWYKNDVKTEFKAIGQDGVNGQDGTDGQDGANGENGQYYVPNPETGNFDIYKDGKLVESTDISWKAGGMTAVFKGSELTLSGVDLGDGTMGDVTFKIGTQLGSVAFVPEVVSNDIPYPTTTDEFYHLPVYLDEAKYNPATLDFVEQANFDKSNVIETIYRLNPSDANIESAVLAFINREVKTRAAADKKNLLNNVTYTWNKEEGTVTVKTTVNASALVDAPEENIAALQVWAGQNPVTSDYIHVESEGIDVNLADSLQTLKADELVEFYPRTKSIGKGESDAFVKQFVALGDEANLEFAYDESIDLKKYVGLYSEDKAEFLAELGFTGMSYDFTLVSEYKSNDDQKTNQQWYVKETEEGVIKVDESHLTEGLTPAVGKTPVVRVDAYLTSNAGVRRLVASSYIKLKITDIATTPGEDKDPITAEISATKNYEYHTMKQEGMTTVVGEMPWQEVNNVIYGKTGLNSQNFWNYYGENKNQYEIKVTTTEQNGAVKELISRTATADQLVSFIHEGIEFEVMLNKGETQTSNIKIGVNNKVKTENTYKDMNGLGAEYKVTVTIPSNNKEQRGDIVLSQIFNVKEDCQKFVYNPLYLEGENTIVVKGQLNAANTWEMSSVVNEHFERIDGKNIFQYYSNINNIAVNGLSFQWATGTTGVTPDASVVNTNDFTVALDGAMTESEVIKNMTYKTTLINGETCNFNYNIKFINPFVATEGTGIEVYGNGIGENKGDVKTQLLVNDTEGDAIYRWNGTSLVLTSKATTDYKLAVPTVTYAFDEDNADYQTIKANMSAGSILNIDNQGVFTWKNEGAKLTRDYTLSVKATVTFEDLSEVVCTIPVVLKAEK